MKICTTSHRPPDPRVRRGVAHLLNLGDRAATESLLEFARQHGLEAELAEHLDRWRALDAGTVRAVLGQYCGDRQFPPTMRVVA